MEYIISGEGTGEHLRAELDKDNDTIKLILRVVNPGKDLPTNIRFNPLIEPFRESCIARISRLDWWRITKTFVLPPEEEDKYEPDKN
jgi:hypothetical protein